METVMITASRRPPALILSAVITLLTLLIAREQNTPHALLLAIPFSLTAYALYFSIGTAAVAAKIRKWCDGRLPRLLVVPLLLAALLSIYVALAGGQPWRGNSWQIPLLFCAPVLFYHRVVAYGSTITWKDGVGAVLCFLPYVLHDYPFTSELPIAGGGIESLYLTLAIVAAVYSLVAVRRLERVGFIASYSLDALRMVLKAWAALFTLVLLIGIPGGLLQWVGYEPITPALLISALALFLRTLFGTALPEELVFRGVLQNLLQQRLEQTGHWQRYHNASLLLLPLAAVAGYTIEGSSQWFPLLVATSLWAMTRWLNGREAALAPFHVALLIVSILFGLAHYHIRSILFMGLAMIAGWVYGYVYHKSGSVFYAALTHTLINTAPGLFGLMIVR